jgi:PTS system nitrogen regulatory IIA component
LPKVCGIFARLTNPIEFAAVDDLPVDIVFMLLSPPDAGAEHLKALARVSRMLRDANFVDKLRGAGSRDALVALLMADEARDAA